MKRYTVTLITGDGTGPELVAIVKEVVAATGIAIDWDQLDAGETALAKYGTPLPEAVLASIRRNRVALKGPITTPIGTGFRSVNVALRQELDLYACLRPCKIYPGVRTRYDRVDIVVVRENTEDLYAGVEFEAGSEIARYLVEHSKGRIRSSAAISIKPISPEGTARIVTFAFEYARKHGRRKVTAVAKANIMKYTDGLFFSVARDIAGKYSDIAYEERLVDNMCMQLVQKPELYDVLVLPNLYGDIISDLCAGLIGGLGVAPGANYGDDCAVFEAVHGSAPKYAGQHRVNPTALLLSAVLMLEHLGEVDAARRMEQAIADVIREGKTVTYDLGGSARNDEMADAIISRLSRG